MSEACFALDNYQVEEIRLPLLVFCSAGILGQCFDSCRYHKFRQLQATHISWQILILRSDEHCDMTNGGRDCMTPTTRVQATERRVPHKLIVGAFPLLATAHVQR